VKWLAIALGVVIAILQYRLWLSDSGVRELGRMQDAVAQQRTQNAALVDRNKQLAAEVRDLKTGMAALEERARSELGMIAGNETYYQVVPAKPDAPPRAAPAQVAAR
jgi:cell division protein FtsB